MSIRDLILSADDRRSATVDVPEWRTTVTIREFSAAERDAVEAEIVAARMNKRPVENLRAKIAARIIIDPATRERVFTDAQAVELGGKSAKALDRIFDAHVKLNALSDEERAEYEKNSSAAPTGN